MTGIKRVRRVNALKADGTSNYAGIRISLEEYYIAQVQGRLVMRQGEQLIKAKNNLSRESKFAVVASDQVFTSDPLGDKYFTVPEDSQLKY